MKLPDIILTANQNLRRSKARTILTVVAIIIGAVTLTLTNGIGAGINSYIDEQLGNVGAEDMLIIQPKSDNPFSNDVQEYDPEATITNAGGFPTAVLTSSDIQKIKSQPGILDAYFDISTAPDYIEGVNGKKLKMLPNNFYDGINVQLNAGTIPTNQTSENQVALPIPYVSALGFKSSEEAIGKTVRIAATNALGQQSTVEGKVVAVLEQSLISQGGVMINRTLALAIYDVQSVGLPEDKKDQQPFAVAHFDKESTDEEITAIKKGLDKMGYTAITIQDQIGIFKQVIDAIIAVLNFFAAIALLAASFGIVNTLLMAVQERTKEIGLMKAMGMSGRRVFLLFAVEAILLGFWGSLIGNLIGRGIGAIANQIADKTFAKDLVGFSLTSFPVASTLVIMAIIMGIAFLAGTLPARRASKKDPIEALRYE